MNEWLNENESSQDVCRSLRIRTESCDSYTPTSSSYSSIHYHPPTIEEESMPSPQHVVHIRRNSTSIVTSSDTLSPSGVDTGPGGSLGTSSAIKQFTAAQLNNTSQEPSFGSAKKRWLRQAMFDRSDSVPISQNQDVNVTSPGNSPLLGW